MDGETEEERLAFIMSYGVDEEEARLSMAISDVYKIKYARLQEQYGYYTVPLSEQLRLGEETRKAYAMVIDARNATQAKVKAAEKRAAEKAAKEAAAGVTSEPQPTSAQRPSGATSAQPATTTTPSAQRAPAGALGGAGGLAGGGASEPRQHARVAPAQPSAGSADDAARALAAFGSRPDTEEK